MKEIIIQRLNAILGLLPTPAVANRDTPTEEADGNIVTCLFDDLYMKVTDLRDDIQNDELTPVNPEIDIREERIKDVEACPTCGAEIKLKMSGVECTNLKCGYFECY